MAKKPQYRRELAASQKAHQLALCDGIMRKARYLRTLSTDDPSFSQVIICSSGANKSGTKIALLPEVASSIREQGESRTLDGTGGMPNWALSEDGMGKYRDR
jgi:hypothetical protein